MQRAAELSSSCRAERSVRYSDTYRCSRDCTMRFVTMPPNTVVIAMPSTPMVTADVLPNGDRGTMSPYPTVLNVTKTNQMHEGRSVKALSLVVPYGRSEMKTM